MQHLRTIVPDKQRHKKNISQEISLPLAWKLASTCRKLIENPHRKNWSEVNAHQNIKAPSFLRSLDELVVHFIPSGIFH